MKKKTQTKKQMIKKLSNHYVKTASLKELRDVYVKTYSGIMESLEEKHLIKLLSNIETHIKKNKKSR